MNDSCSSHLRTFLEGDLNSSDDSSKRKLRISDNFSENDQNTSSEFLFSFSPSTSGHSSEFFESIDSSFTSTTDTDVNSSANSSVSTSRNNSSSANYSLDSSPNGRPSFIDGEGSLLDESSLLTLSETSFEDGENNGFTIGLTMERIDKFPTFVADEHSVEKGCTICIDDVVIGKPMMRLDCNHSYCSDCIRGWFECNSSCPQCRRNFYTSE